MSSTFVNHIQSTYLTYLTYLIFVASPITGNATLGPWTGRPRASMFNRIALDLMGSHRGSTHGCLMLFDGER